MKEEEHTQQPLQAEAIKWTGIMRDTLKSTRKAHRLFSESPFVPAIYKLFGLPGYSHNTHDKHVFAFQIAWGRHANDEILRPVALKIWGDQITPLLRFLESPEAAKYAKFLTKGADYIDQGILWSPFFINSYQAGELSTSQLADTIRESSSLFIKKQVQRKIIYEAFKAAFASTAHYGGELIGEIGAGLAMRQMTIPLMRIATVASFFAPASLVPRVAWFGVRMLATDYAISKMEPYWKPGFNRLITGISKFMQANDPEWIAQLTPVTPSASPPKLIGQSTAIAKPATEPQSNPIQPPPQDNVFVVRLPSIAPPSQAAQPKVRSFGPTTLSVNNHSGKLQYRLSTSNPFFAGAILTYFGVQKLHHYLHPTMDEQFTALHKQILRYSLFAQNKKDSPLSDTSRELAKVRKQAETLLKSMPSTSEMTLQKIYALNVITACNFNPAALVHPNQSLEAIQNQIMIGAEQTFAHQANLAITRASPGVFSGSYAILDELRKFFPYKSSEILYTQSIVEGKAGRYGDALKAVDQSISQVSLQKSNLELKLNNITQASPHLDTFLCEEIRQGRLKASQSDVNHVQAQDTLRQLLRDKQLALHTLQEEKAKILFERANHSKQSADRDAFKQYAEPLCHGKLAIQDLAHKLAYLNDLDTAASLYEKVLDPNHAEEVLHLGALYKALDRNDKTLALFERFSEKHHHDEISQYLVSEYGRTKQFDKLIHQLSRFPAEDVWAQYLIGIAYIERACTAKQQEIDDMQGYQEGKKRCQHFLDTALDPASTDENQKHMVKTLKATLADGAIFYESPAEALRAVQAYLAVDPTHEPSLLNAAKLSFDGKHTKQAKDYLQQILTQNPTCTEASQLNKDLQAYSENRMQLFQFDMALFLLTESLNYATQKEWVKDIVGKRGEKVAKITSIALQTGNILGQHYLREQCASSLEKIQKTPPKPNPQPNSLSNLLSLANVVTAIQLGLNTLSGLDTLGMLPDDEESRKRLQSCFLVGATTADIGCIALAAKSLSDAGITTLSQLAADNQALLGSLSAITAACRIINRFTYEQWRLENKALPENAFSYVLEDGLAIVSSASWILALAGKCAEHPEETATLLSYIPGATELPAYLADGGATIANGVGSLWAMGAVGQAAVVTGGLALAAGVGYGIYCYIYNRESQTIAYNALAARNRGEFEESRRKYEQLYEREKTPLNQKKFDIAHGEYLLSQKRWPELLQFTSMQLQKAPDSTFFELRARANEALQQTDAAKQGFREAIRLMPEKDKLRRFKLYLSLMNVAPDDAAAYDGAFKTQQEMKTEFHGEILKQAGQLLKNGVINQTRKKCTDAKHMQLIQDNLNKLLEGNANDPEVFLAKGQLFLASHSLNLAIHELEKAFRFAKTPEQRYHAAISQAEGHLNQGHFTEAENCLQLAKQNQSGTQQEKDDTDKIQIAIRYYGTMSQVEDHLKNGRFTEAANCLQLARQNQVNTPQAKEYTAQIQVALRYYDAMSQAEGHLKKGHFIEAENCLQLAKQNQVNTPHAKDYTQHIQNAITQSIQNTQEKIIEYIASQFKPLITQVDGTSDQHDFDATQANQAAAELKDSLEEQLAALTAHLPPESKDLISAKVTEKHTECLNKVAKKKENVKIQAWRQVVTTTMDCLVRGAVYNFFDSCHAGSRAEAAHLAAELRVLSNTSCHPGLF